MTTREEHEAIKQSADTIAKILEQDDLSDDEREKFESLLGMSAGFLTKTWLPIGWERRSIMFVLFLVGLYGLVVGNYYFLFSWLFILMFSPRFVGNACMIYGAIKRA